MVREDNYRNKNRRHRNKSRDKKSEKKTQTGNKNRHQEVKNVHESQQNTSIYPYTRKQLGEQLRKKDFQKGEQVVDPKYVPRQIKYNLDEMNLYGYDFWYSACYQLWKQFKSIGEPKAMRRCCYLRMQCDNCIDDKSRKERRWTTSGGTVEIKFMLIPLKLFFQVKKIKKRITEKFPYVIIFRHYVYKMKCQQCLEWGKVYIYRSVMDAVTRLFCRIIAEILHQVPRNLPKKGDLKRLLRNHKYSLCQACQKGACLVPKGLSMQIVYIDADQDIQDQLCYECACLVHNAKDEFIVVNEKKKRKYDLCGDCVDFLREGNKVEVIVDRQDDENDRD